MKRNFLYTAISVGSRLFVAVVLFVLLARLWGPSEFGRYSLAFSAAALLAIFVDFGFVVYLMREVAANQKTAHSLILHALRAKFALLLGMLFLIVPTAVWFASPTVSLSIFLPLLLAALVTSFGDFFVAPLRAFSRFDIEARVIASTNALLFFSVGYISWTGGSTENVAWTTLFSRVIYFFSAWRALRTIVPNFSIRDHSVESPLVTLRRIFPYGADGALVTAWNQLDVVAVRYIFGIQAVGLYSAGQKIVLGTGSLATIVGNVLVPRLAGLASTRSLKFWPLALQTMALMLVCGMVLSAPLIVVPELVVIYLFGDSYSQMIGLLPWFGCVLIARFASAGAGAVITGAGLQGRRVWAQAIGLLFSALLVGIGGLFFSDLAFFLKCIASGLLLTTVLTIYWTCYLRQKMSLPEV